MPHELEIAFFTVNLERDSIAWAVPCISTSSRGLPGNLFGFLVATERPGPKLAFVARRGWKHAATELELTGYKVAHEPKFLSENIVLYSLEKKPKYIFLFARSQRAIVKAVVADLEERLATSLPAPEEPAPLEEPRAGQCAAVWPGAALAHSMPKHAGLTTPQSSIKSSHFSSSQGSRART